MTFALLRGRKMERKIDSARASKFRGRVGDRDRAVRHRRHCLFVSWEEKGVHTSAAFPDKTKETF